MTTEPAQPMQTPSFHLLLMIFAKNEENQLEKTVRCLQAVCPAEHVAGMVLFLAPNATEGCLRTAKALQNTEFPIPVEVFVQPSYDVPGCVKAVLADRQGISHVLFSAADEYVESSTIAHLITCAAQDRSNIYKLSRTLPGGDFSSDYSRSTVLLYKIFCVFIRILFRSKVTDPVFAVVVAPVHLFLLTRFQVTSLLFYAEWMFALLRRKTPITEFPALTLPRTEFNAFSSIFSRLRYVPIALRMRFLPKHKIFMKGIDAQ